MVHLGDARPSHVCYRVHKRSSVVWEKDNTMTLDERGQSGARRWRRNLRAVFTSTLLSEEAKEYFKTDGKCSACKTPSTIGRGRDAKSNYRLLRSDGIEFRPQWFSPEKGRDPSGGGGGAMMVGDPISATLVGLGMAAMAAQTDPEWGLQIQCKNCGYTWPYYRWDASKSAEPQIKITPTEKSEELDLPRDHWTIDNSQSSAGVRQRNQVDRQWSKTINVTYEEATKDVQGISIKAPVGIGTVTLNKAIEAQLRQAFNLSGSETETKTREVEVTVPPHKKVRVTIEWTLVWQHGRIELHYPTDNRGHDELPFKLPIELRSYQTT